MASKNGTQKKLIAKQVIDEFDLEIANVDSSDQTKEITELALHRAGIELASGFVTGHLRSSIIAWGSDEHDFLKSLGKEKSLKSISNVLSANTPLIVLSKKMEDEVAGWIIDVANKSKIPVCRTNDHLATSIATLGAFLIEYFAPQDVIHASLIVVRGLGILIIGESGIGKSEAVIELISKGHTFVADDSVVVWRVGNKIFGKSSEITEGILESRGLGLLEIPHVFGASSVTDDTPVDLVIELKKQDAGVEFERIGKELLSHSVLGAKIPLIQIPVTVGRSVSTLMEVAVNMYVSGKKGSHPLDKIMERGWKND